MSKHDEKIKELLKNIDAKKEALGVKPRASWKSNALIKTDGMTCNINTLSSIDDCINVAAILLQQIHFQKMASELFEVEYQSHLQDHLDDLQLRASILKWNMEQKKIDHLEKKLKDLRSEDAKTSDALDDIMKELS